MSISIITINKRKFSIQCSPESEKRLQEVANKLDLAVQKFLNTTPHASLEIAIMMVALQLMDQKMSKQENTAGEVLSEMKHEFDQQLFTIMSELKSVANKLEH